MPTQTNLFLLEDLEDVGKTSELAESDLDALHATADWIKTYVVKPHKSSSWTTRTGSTCGRVALENPQSTLLLRNFAACRGARAALAE